MLVIEREPDERNRKVWPLIIMKIIIELLVNGAKPTAACKNLESAVRIMCPQVRILELPNIDYVRKMRGIIRIITETLSKDQDWKQLWWDGTSRRTV